MAYGATGKARSFGEQVTDDPDVGTYGLKVSYQQDNPPTQFAPANYGPFREQIERWHAAKQLGAQASFVAARRL